ncbi:MAG: hypothetical protein SP4CHLAM5_09080 [Chlamydiia bacterium]|nr:hypothetical protein [Chlamydiia bacterium]MCH9618770.1 hypothetical protein [Chlamydiia bacterium]MCH9624429.1 hypothetical protein [Chlamydiia bacterium]
MTFKENWEKTQSRHHLSDKIIRQMLAMCYPDTKINNYKIIDGGCANINIKAEITNSSSPILLRVYIRNPNSAYIEQKIAEKLQGKVPIPQIYYIGETSGYTFARAEYIYGSPLRKTLLTDKHYHVEEIMHKVGLLLGEIAQVKFDKSGFFNEDLKILEPFAESGSKYCLNALEHENSQAILTEIERNTIRHLIKENIHLFPESEEKNLVHADFDPANILVMDDDNDHTQVTGVLDWEFCYSGSTITDVANMLRYAHHMPPCYEKGFLDGLLESGYQLPKYWRKTMHLLNLMSLLDSLNRTKLEDKPNQIKDIKELISHILSDFFIQKNE